MVYIAAILLALFCIGIIIYVVKVYREDKKTRPKTGYHLDDDDDILRHP